MINENLVIGKVVPKLTLARNLIIKKRCLESEVQLEKGINLQSNRVDRISNSNLRTSSTSHDRSKTKQCLTICTKITKWCKLLSLDSFDTLWHRISPNWRRKQTWLLTRSCIQVLKRFKFLRAHTWVMWWTWNLVSLGWKQGKMIQLRERKVCKKGRDQSYSQISNQVKAVSFRIPAKRCHQICPSSIGNHCSRVLWAPNRGINSPSSRELFSSFRLPHLYKYKNRIYNWCRVKLWT